MGWFEGTGLSQLQNAGRKDRTVPSQQKSRISEMTIRIKYITDCYPYQKSHYCYISKWSRQFWRFSTYTGFKQSYLLLTFCICDWANSLKPSCITNTFHSTMALQHPLEPVWFPEVEVPLKHWYIWSLYSANTQNIVLSVHINFCAVEAHILIFKKCKDETRRMPWNFSLG